MFTKCFENRIYNKMNKVLLQILSDFSNTWVPLYDEVLVLLQYYHSANKTRLLELASEWTKTHLKALSLSFVLYNKIFKKYSELIFFFWDVTKCIFFVQVCMVAWFFKESLWISSFNNVSYTIVLNKLPWTIQ